MDKQPGQVYLMDSASGFVSRVTGFGATLLTASAQTADYISVVKEMVDAPARSTGSKRLKEKYGITLDGVTCATRPFDFYIYAFATTLNTYHCRAIRAKAKDIAGAKWKITGGNSDTKRKAIKAYVKGLFPGRGFKDGMETVWTDFEAIGNGFIEVIPDAKKRPAELAHIPSPEMWIRLDGLGFVQQKNGQYAHFRAYGLPDEKFAELKSGDPLLKDGITSVHHLSQYFPWSLYYGIPSIMPAWNRMALAVLETEYNLRFFENNAVPDYAITLSGEWADDSETKIRDYFNKHLKGKAHKTLVVQTPEGGTIKYEKLTGDNAKEGSFRLLRVDCRDEVLHAHGVPPSKAGIHETGRLGGKDGFEQNQEYKDSIVTPGRDKVVEFVDELIAAAFDEDDYHFEQEPYNTDDVQTNSAVDDIYLKDQVLTPNEVRGKRFPDYAPLEGGDAPLPWKTGGDAGTEAALKTAQRVIRRRRA